VDRRSEHGPPPSPVDAVLDRYRNHLRDMCGLTEVTCSYRLQHAREFLGGKFGEGPIDWADLRPADPISFVEGYAARCRPGTAQVVASSLRSLLRFLQLHGYCARTLGIARRAADRTTDEPGMQTVSVEQIRVAVQPPVSAISRYQVRPTSLVDSRRPRPFATSNNVHPTLCNHRLYGMILS
jgi:hypothetical protein